MSLWRRPFLCAMFSRVIFLRGKSFIRLSDDCFVSLWLWCLECTVFCGSCTETIGSSPLKIPEALKSCMRAPCADYLLQDDCDFKNLYFSQKSPQCDPIALLVRENSGQNFNWSSIMWKTTTLLWLYVLCLGGLNPRWGAITTHSLSLKAATPQPLKKHE